MTCLEEAAITGWYGYVNRNVRGCGCYAYKYVCLWIHTFLNRHHVCNTEADARTRILFLKSVTRLLSPPHKSRPGWGGGKLYIRSIVTQRASFRIVIVLRSAAQTCTHFMSHYSVFLTVDASLQGAFVIGLNWDARCLSGGPWVSRHRFASLSPLLADSFHGDRVISGRLNTICGGALLMNSLVLWAGESKARRK